MKLFIYKPKSQGESFFSVVEENEKQAFDKVDKYIKSKYPKGGFESDGWESGYYELETKEIGEVYEQENS